MITIANSPTYFERHNATVASAVPKSSAPHDFAGTMRSSQRSTQRDPKQEEAAGGATEGVGQDAVSNPAETKPNQSSVPGWQITSREQDGVRVAPGAQPPRSDAADGGSEPIAHAPKSIAARVAVGGQSGKEPAATSQGKSISSGGKAAHGTVVEVATGAAIGATTEVATGAAIGAAIGVAIGASTGTTQNVGPSPASAVLKSGEAENCSEATRGQKATQSERPLQTQTEASPSVCNGEQLMEANAATAGTATAARNEITAGASPSAENASKGRQRTSVSPVAAAVQDTAHASEGTISLVARDAIGIGQKMSPQIDRANSQLPEGNDLRSVHGSMGDDLPRSVDAGKGPGLEIAFAGGEHGPVNVRATMQSDGTVAASLLPANRAGHASLLGDTSGISHYLSEQRLPVASLEVLSPRNLPALSAGSSAGGSTADSSLNREGQPGTNGDGQLPKDATSKQDVLSPVLSVVPASRRRQASDYGASTAMLNSAVFGPPVSGWISIRV